MATAGVTIKEYNQKDSLVAGLICEKVVTIKSGEGALVRGQVVAYNTTDGTWVKYTSGGANGEEIIRGVLNEAVDTSLEAKTAKIIVEGEILSTGLTGVNFVLDTETLATPAAPTLALVAGGSLAATTAHKYKTTAINKSGAITAAGAVATGTTLAAAAGSAAGLVVANIAAVNTLLGDCTTTAKVVQFTVDGVANSATFALDYSGAGALADHAALITALELTATGVTATSSDAAAVTLTSDSTGAASSILITADTTGLFLAPTYTDGVAESETIKVTVPAIAGAVDYRVWRSVDGGTVYLYRDMTDAEIALGYFVDDGTLTYAAGTPVAATDYLGIAQMFDRGIYTSEMNEGFNFRGGY